MRHGLEQIFLRINSMFILRYKKDLRSTNKSIITKWLKSSHPLLAVKSNYLKKLIENYSIRRIDIIFLSK